MTAPNTLPFVDVPSADPAASGAFDAEVLGWEVEPWGNTFVLWTKGGDDPQLPAGDTGE